MYSQIIRSDAYRQDLLCFIFSTYGIEGRNLSPAKRGFYGETWRLETADDNCFFVKLVYPEAYKAVYERSFPVIQHLNDQGIGYISRIVKTKASRLCTVFDGAVLGVFDWIDGKLTETDETKAPEYGMMAKIYTVPPGDVPISREDFGGGNAQFFLEQWMILEDKSLRALLEKHREILEYRLERQHQVSGWCRGDSTAFYITHGDAGGNLLVNGGQYYIVDWDTPLLAPPERDAWCMCGHAWAREAFHHALCQNGIAYTLRPERLIYYCYEYFFYYLSCYLDVRASAVTVETFINGWITQSLAYADR